MMLIFVGGLIWGSLSAQFLVQTITSLIIASIYFVALIFSKVPKRMNGMAGLVSLVQAIIFAAFLAGGNWIVADYIDFRSWNAVSIASVVSFLVTLIYCAVQMPGTILFAKLSAWAPFFTQAAMRLPRHERMDLAWRYRASPMINTLYAPRPPQSPELDQAT